MQYKVIYTKNISKQLMTKRYIEMNVYMHVCEKLSDMLQPTHTNSSDHSETLDVTTNGEVCGAFMLLRALIYFR